MSSERIEAFYRDATAADVARVMAGEVVDARFRNNGSSKTGRIAGWLLIDVSRWVDVSGFQWDHCQVYDPPQWYVDKPEPGEGYRLLGKFPDEPVLAGDFIKDVDGAWRELVSPCNPVQGMTCWYRRRIDPPKPEPKRYKLQVGDTIETPSLLRIVVTELGIEVQ